MIISDTKKERAFFEELESKYRSLPIDQRKDFLNRAAQVFQEKTNEIRDRTSEVERGQDIEGRYCIDNSRSRRGLTYP